MITPANQRSAEHYKQLFPDARTSTVTFIPSASNKSFIGMPTLLIVMKNVLEINVQLGGRVVGSDSGGVAWRQYSGCGWRQQGAALCFLICFD